MRLDQVVTFDDGEVIERTWRLVKLDASTYTATLSDAAGPVSTEATGSRFHLRYRLRKPAIYMEQWLYLRPDGRTVLNLATVTVLGIPWARLTEEIAKIDGCEESAEGPGRDENPRAVQRPTAPSEAEE